MFHIAKPFFFVCETPLHAGAGGGVGTELPIQREEHTRFPKVEASGLKGAFREVFESKFPGGGMNEDVIRLFGHPTDGDRQAGALGLTDGRLLLFPVRSRLGVFAWTTCPRVIKRFARDLQISTSIEGGESVAKLLGLVNNLNLEKCTVVPSNAICEEGSVWLEEYSIRVESDLVTKAFVEELSELLNIKELSEHIVIIPDDYFTHFVEHCTEVHTRIKIGKDGVVEDGQLFTEEHLPAESILYSLALAHPEFISGSNKKKAAEILEIFTKNLPGIVQIGGNATLGKGIIRISKKLF